MGSLIDISIASCFQGFQKGTKCENLTHGLLFVYCLLHDMCALS